MHVEYTSSLRGHRRDDTAEQKCALKASGPDVSSAALALRFSRIDVEADTSGPEKTTEKTNVQSFCLGSTVPIYFVMEDLPIEPLGLCSPRHTANFLLHRATTSAQ